MKLFGKEEGEERRNEGKKEDPKSKNAYLNATLHTFKCFTYTENFICLTKPVPLQRS